MSVQPSTRSTRPRLDLARSRTTDALALRQLVEISGGQCAASPPRSWRSCAAGGGAAGRRGGGRRAAQRAFSQRRAQAQRGGARGLGQRACGLARPAIRVRGVVRAPRNAAPACRSVARCRPNQRDRAPPLSFCAREAFEQGPVPVGRQRALRRIVLPGIARIDHDVGGARRDKSVQTPAYRRDIAPRADFVD